MSAFTQHLPPPGWAACDDHITQVLGLLRSQHEASRAVYIGLNKLIEILDLLFDRKTFRHEEKIESCLTHDWAGRLHSALMTQRVLNIYRPNVLEMATPAQYLLYSEVLVWIDRYIESMAGLLFRKQISYQALADQVGGDDCEAFLRQYQPRKGLQNLLPTDVQRINNTLSNLLQNANDLRQWALRAS
jgi:hypothetical protein